MLNHTFTFNGHTSDEFGIKIERFRALSRPGRKYDAASVPGRNGILYKLQEAWEEILVSYEIFAEASVGDTEADIDKENGTYFTWTADGLTINGTIPAVIQEEVGKLIATRNRTILVQGGTAGTYALTCRVERDGVTLRMEVITTGSETFVLSAGDELYIDLSADGTFNNFVTPFKIIDAEILDLPKKWTDIMEWLNSADGYAELTDTYDPEHYYEAVFVDGPEIANSWNKYGRAVVSFRCRPERFLSDAEVVLSDLEQADVGHITSDPLNLRKGPGTSYPIFAWLRTNDKFAILDTKTADSITWYKICTLDRKKEGWCDSQYVATEQMYLLVNPTDHIAKPTIRFDVVSNTINDADISINDTKIDIDTGAVLFYSTTIDCENENVSGVDQSYEEQPFNSYATVTTLNGATTTQFLKLEPGNNYLDSSLATSISVVITINPHFWEI